MQNQKVKAENLYVPLPLNAIVKWQETQIYLALDTTLLWNKYCFISLAVITGGRAVPFLWLGLEHNSASVEWEKYQPLLDKTHEYLKDFENVTLLADRGFANQELVGWLQRSRWHWAIRQIWGFSMGIFLSLLCSPT
ncbi:MAG: transposase [Cyanobacteriota bacterium]|nr:transposase [Cyanobacteriota bacterium]